MPISIKSPKDFWCGLLLLAIAGVFVAGLTDLEIGSAFRMGPGFYPLVLTILLAFLGLLILLNGLRLEGPPVGEMPLRAIFFIALPIIIFGVTVRGLGFVLSLAITILATTFALPGWRPLVALPTMAALIFLCVAIFVYGLGLPIPLFGPWVGGY